MEAKNRGKSPKSKVKEQNHGTNKEESTLQEIPEGEPTSIR
jgi:hypothetical protein